MISVSADAAFYFAQYSHDHDKVFALNLSAPYVSQVFGQDLMKVYAFADLVFGNETELDAFAQLNALRKTDRVELVKQMANLDKRNRNRARIVIITQASEPTLVSDGTDVRSFEVPKVPANEIIDTNGAGDAFVSGFLASFMRGHNLDACIENGHSVAGQMIRTSGVHF